MLRFLFFLSLLFTFISLAAADGDKPVIAVLGDSYSTFQGHVTPERNELWYFSPAKYNTDVDARDQCWWAILTAPDKPYQLGVNNSYSGATICFTGYHGDDFTDRSFVTRMYNLGDPDIILILGATNDSWANSPIGEKVKDVSKTTRSDLFYFTPAINYLLKKIQILYPKAKVYYVLNSELKPEINAAVEDACKANKVPLIKLHDISKRGGHPDRAGMKAIASQVEEVISK